MLFWFALLVLLLVVATGFCAPGPAARVAAIAEDCEFPRFGRLGKSEGGSKGNVFCRARSVGFVVGIEDKNPSAAF